MNSIYLWKYMKRKDINMEKENEDLTSDEESDQKEEIGLENTTSQEETPKEKKKTLRRVLCIILILLLLLLFLRRCSNSDVKEGSITFQNKKEVTESLNETADASNFIVLANTNISIVNGQADIMVENSDKNVFMCVIDVFIDDTKVYTSDKMKPGSYIDKVTIDHKKISDGIHKGKTVFKVLNTDGSIRSNMSIETTVTIK